MQALHFRPSATLGVLVLSTLAATAQQAPVPPIAKRVEHKAVWHGETVVDPYFWLREKSDPEVAKYLESENAYTEAMTKDLKPFQGRSTKRYSVASSRPT